MKLVFHPFAVVNPLGPLDNDPVVCTNDSPGDNEEVVQFVLDDDLAPMRHVRPIDDVDVPLA